MDQDFDNARSPESPPGDFSGGLGGLPLVDERTSGQDLRLIRRAIRNDWPISAEMRSRVMLAMDEIISDCPDPRSQVAAARVLITADAVNAKREQMDQAAELKKQPDLHLHASATPPARVVIMFPDNGR